ncbi:MAG TPA: MFS transporter, partial [Acidimicrobiales bacterium]
GVGSAMNDTTRELGGSLGVAVLGSVVTSQYTSGVGGSLAALPDQARALADSGLAGALRVAGEIGGVQGDTIAGAAKAAFVDGLGTAALVGSVVVFVAAFVSWKLLPRTTLAPFVSPPRDADQAVDEATSLVG